MSITVREFFELMREKGYEDEPMLIEYQDADGGGGVVEVDEELVTFDETYGWAVTFPFLAATAPMSGSDFYNWACKAVEEGDGNNDR